MRNLMIFELVIEFDIELFVGMLFIKVLLELFYIPILFKHVDLWPWWIFVSIRVMSIELGWLTSRNQVELYDLCPIGE